MRSSIRLLTMPAAAFLLTLALPCRAEDETPDKTALPEVFRPGRTRSPVLMLDGLAGVTNSAYASDMFGARAQLSFPWQGAFALGASFTFQDQSFSRSENMSMATGHDGSSSEHVGDVYSGGVVLSWGAPVTNCLYGLAFEMGVSGGSRKVGAASSDPNADGKPDSFLSPYAQASLILQAPIWKAARPYLALSGRHTFDEFGDSAQTAMLSLGIAFEPF